MACQKVIVRLLFLVLLTSPGFGLRTDASPKDKHSNFNILIDQLTDQIDKQTQDRDKQIKALQALYDKINDIEGKNLDQFIGVARRAAISREAMLTADEMIRDPKNKARVTELAGFLRRSITRDQQLFDQYVRRSETSRFEYERQIAKIKSEQTVLINIRRDLDRLKRFPTNKEQMSFFLNSVKSLLDGLGKAP